MSSPLCSQPPVQVTVSKTLRRKAPSAPRALGCSSTGDCVPALRPRALLPLQLGWDQILNHESTTLRVTHSVSGSVLGAGDTTETEANTGPGMEPSWSLQPLTGPSVTWVSRVKLPGHHKPGLSPQSSGLHRGGAQAPQSQSTDSCSRKRLTGHAPRTSPEPGLLPGMTQGLPRSMARRVGKEGHSPHLCLLSPRGAEHWYSHLPAAGCPRCPLRLPPAAWPRGWTIRRTTGTRRQDKEVALTNQKGQQPQHAHLTHCPQA